jgi:isoquinoline 1-oxidoreductase alpha subunit
MMTPLTVNRRSIATEADPDTPLLWVLRDHLGLTGTKFGCGIGVCGACTVHLDGAAIRSCLVTLAEVGTAHVTTIEGLAADRSHPVQQAWVAHDVPQCGYCQSGMVMAVAALLKENSSPTEDDLTAAVTNICRCGTYKRVTAAALDAAKRLREG